MAIGSVWLRFILTLSTGFGQIPERTSDIPIITVCEALHDLARYNGKTIVIVGRLVSTMEGSWLSEECGHTMLIDGHTLDSIILLTYTRSKVEPPPNLPNGFKWGNKRLKTKLDEVRKTTKLQSLPQYHYRDKWLALFGRVETRVPPQMLEGGGGSSLEYGFGHLNAAIAQLISPEKGFHALKAK